jgi:hypothetical protein
MIEGAWIGLALVLDLVPPPEYDYIPPRPHVIHEVREGTIRRHCGLPIADESIIVFGCADWVTGDVWILEGMTPEVRAIVIRHEFAHLNGWRHE